MADVAEVAEQTSNRIVLGGTVIDISPGFHGSLELERLLRKTKIAEKVDIKESLRHREQWRTARIDGINVAEFGIYGLLGQPLMVFRDGKISLADLANYFKLENREVVLAGRNDSEEGTWSALLAPSLNYKPSVGNYGHIGTAQLSRLHLYVEQSKDSGIIVARLGYRPVEFRFTRSEKREFLL